MPGIINISRYTVKHNEIPEAKNHPFNDSFKTTCESFASRGINITSRNGMMDVIDNDVNYEAYKDALYGDIQNEDVRESMKNVFDHSISEVRRSADNGGNVTYEDGSSSNASIFAYMNGPVIRAIWARCIVPALMKVSPLNVTQFEFTMDIPYILKDGVRTDLPYGMTDADAPIFGLTPLVAKAGSNPGITTDGVFTFITNQITGNLLSESLQGITVTRGDGRAVDAKIRIKNIKYHGPENKTNTTQTPVSTPSTYVGVIAPYIAGRGAASERYFYVKIDDVYTLKTVTEPTTTYSWVPTSGTIMGMIDLATGEYRFTSTTVDILSFELEAYLSSEDNRTPAVLKTEQHVETITLGTGQHIMVDTPVELLQDYSPAHQGCDYVVAMTDIASEAIAGNMNLEFKEFIKQSRLNPESAQYIDRRILKGLNINNGAFDIRVAHGENPSAYTDQQMKKCMAWYANQIKSVARIEDGYWSVYGHANNVMYIPDFKTEGFATMDNGSESAEQTLYGFKMGYSFGFATNNMLGGGKFRCITSPEFRMNEGLTSFFTSTDEKRPTYIFYPYSYTVSRGYINGMNSSIPSLMITKRHMFKEFVPMSFWLNITGNDGNQFSKPVGIITPTQAIV